MKHIEAIRVRMRELQEFKQELLHVQNKAFDLKIFEELMLLQKIYSDLGERIDMMQTLVERHDKINDKTNDKIMHRD